ncbi:MAG: putative nucleotidyltransferase with HDIG domain [Cellvibrionaceae bacterium]|jgi:putative nucleotidyltransferase with HDIG domain
MAEIKKKPWRDACRFEMKKAALKEAKARTGKKNPGFIYRWEHVKAVVSQAKKLAEITGADADVIEAAAWLHDIKKHESGSKHAELGARFAGQFLLETNFPKNKIDRVAHAIASHCGLWLDEPLEELEAQVLWDADKLTKVGLTAAFHRIPGDLVRPNVSYTTEDIIESGRANDWQDKTVASFHTNAARKAGAERLKASRLLWKQLAQELKGKDLLELDSM